jgi:hypothetical protein
MSSTVATSTRPTATGPQSVALRMSSMSTRTVRFAWLVAHDPPLTLQYRCVID